MPLTGHLKTSNVTLILRIYLLRNKWDKLCHLLKGVT
nr:MAG TPA: hypothetical protein [Caudoviricetes sp.]